MQEMFNVIRIRKSILSRPSEICCSPAQHYTNKRIQSADANNSVRCLHLCIFFEMHVDADGSTSSAGKNHMVKPPNICATTDLHSRQIIRSWRQSGCWPLAYIVVHHLWRSWNARWSKESKNTIACPNRLANI